MARYAVVAALLAVLAPYPVLAQLTPELGLALLVEVRTSDLNGQGKLDGSLSAAGTTFGVRNDTVYVVTSNHHVQNADQVHVRLTLGGPVLPARVLTGDSVLDFAVLAVAGYTRDPTWPIPTRVARVGAQLRFRETVYVIGCPAGVCWVPPEPAIVSGASDDDVLLRTVAIREGVSGGPVVDGDGALLGIATHYDFGEGTAVRWDRIESEIRRYGYPVNLPERRGHRVREAALRAFLPVFADGDGRQGFRGELTYRIQPALEVEAGVTLVPFEGDPLPNPEAGSRDRYYAGYLSFGVRRSIEILAWRLGRGFPDVFSAGGELLLPLGTSVEQRGRADSVNVGRGHSAPTGKWVGIESNTPGFAFHGVYRIAITEHLGVSVAFTKYALLIGEAGTGVVEAYPSMVEIGADIRDLQPLSERMLKNLF